MTVPEPSVPPDASPPDPRPYDAPSPAGGAPAVATVDIDAIRGNVERLAAHAGSAQVMAVVKADGYGHGLVTAARAAVAGGATWLGTALQAEAVALRDAGLEARILTWLQVPGTDFTAAVSRDIDLGVSTEWALEEIVAAARATGTTARLHLKVDTGLARNGAWGSDFTDLVDRTRALEAEGVVRVVGVWSHLVSAEVVHGDVSRRQREVFEGAVAQAEAAGCRLEVRHLANSAATLTAPELHYDLVRPGIAVYGLTPVPATATSGDLGLVPAMTLTARLANVKRVPGGQGVSYGHVYTTPTETVLGLVPMGYADGVPRAATNVGPVRVSGVRRTVSGRVCMDQFVVDLGPDSQARAGDEVVLFGADPEGPSAQDWADAVGTISYEIVTRIGPNVPRVVVGRHIPGAPSAAPADRAASAPQAL